MAIEEVTVSDDGTRSHPSFATVRVNRVHGSSRNLFDSNVEHNTTIRMSINTATTDESERHIYPRRQLIEIEMTPLQWATLFSSINQGEGTPATINHIAGVGHIPSAPFESRAAKSNQRLRNSVKNSFENIKALTKELNDLESKTSPYKGAEKTKKRKEILDQLNRAMDVAPANVAFASTVAHEDAESLITDVVSSLQVQASVLNTNKENLHEISAPSIPTDMLEITNLDGNE